MTPFGALEWAIARRYLRARRRERAISVVSTLSITGIVLGVAALIIVMSVMNGFRTELFNRILGVSGHVVVQAADGMPQADALADRIEAVPRVERAVPYVLGQAYASGPAGASGVILRGVTPEDFSRTPLVTEHLTVGDGAGFGEGKTMVVGIGLSRALGATIGDTITVMTQDGPVTPFGQTPQIDNFRVVGIFDVGMSQIDTGMAYVPMGEAQLFLNMEERATGIEVFADGPDGMDELKAAIVDATPERALYLSDWRQQNRAYYTALSVERNVMFIILTLIVLVASMNVISSMTMLVNEKTPDIAILRTIGATRGTVLRVFLMVGLTIGVGGTLIGLALGTLIAANIEAIRQAITSLFNIELFPPELYYLTQVPSDISSTQTILVVVISMVLALLATIPPAWKAAATDPVVALKAE